MITTWFWLSVIFFVLSIVLMVGYVALGILVFRFIKEMRPKVDALEQNVQGVVQRVQAVAERVEEVAVSVKSTVDNVGTKARGVASSAEIVAQAASRQFQRFSPVLMGTLTAIRIVGALRDSRRQKTVNQAGKGRPTRVAVPVGKILGKLLSIALK
jgi:uncharacterized protein YoxC